MSMINNSENEEVIRDVIKSVKKIKFGHVQLVIHDSRIVQIDQTEKVRVDKGLLKKEG